MKKRKMLPLFLLLAALLLFIPAARADDGVFLGNGMNIYPVQADGIDLAYEKLIITQNQMAAPPEYGYRHQLTDTVRVDVLFLLVNHGKAQTVTIGFPEDAGYDIDDEDRVLHSHMKNFRTEVDGVPVDTVLQPLAEWNREFDFDQAYIWKTHFDAEQTRIIHNTYEFESSYSSIGSWDVRYILRTGKLWSGPIRRIDVTVRSPIPVPRLRFVPYPDEYSELHLANWEPDWDIVYGSYVWYDEAIFGRGDIGDIYWPNAEKSPRAFYAEEALKRREAIRYYIWGLDSRFLSTCTRQEIQTYINGIYATYGRPFSSKEWALFFEQKWWYQANPAYGDALLSAADQKMIAHLQDYWEKALVAETRTP